MITTTTTIAITTINGINTRNTTINPALLIERNEDPESDYYVVLLLGY
jgi:hypothetical protein